MKVRYRYLESKDKNGKDHSVQGLVYDGFFNFTNKPKFITEKSLKAKPLDADLDNLTVEDIDHIYYAEDRDYFLTPVYELIISDTDYSWTPDENLLDVRIKQLKSRIQSSA